MTDLRPKVILADVHWAGIMLHKPHAHDDKCIKDAAKALHAATIAVLPKLELRADIDEQLLKYVPDMELRSLEVTGVPSSFTVLYTRAVINQAIDQMRKNIDELYGVKK